MVDSVSSAAGASYQSLSVSRAVQAQRAQAPSSVSASDGPDRENDGDADDRASVSPTRGQNVNVLA